MHSLTIASVEDTCPDDRACAADASHIPTVRDVDDEAQRLPHSPPPPPNHPADLDLVKLVAATGSSYHTAAIAAAAAPPPGTTDPATPPPYLAQSSPNFDARRRFQRLQSRHMRVRKDRVEEQVVVNGHYVDLWRDIGTLETWVLRDGGRRANPDMWRSRRTPGDET